VNDDVISCYVIREDVRLSRVGVDLDFSSVHVAARKDQDSNIIQIC